MNPKLSKLLEELEEKVEELEDENYHSESAFVSSLIKFVKEQPNADAVAILDFINDYAFLEY
jgi:hypothetical protein